MDKSLTIIGTVEGGACPVYQYVAVPSISSAVKHFLIEHNEMKPTELTLIFNESMFDYLNKILDYLGYANTSSGGAIGISPDGVKDEWVFQPYQVSALLMAERYCMQNQIIHINETDVVIHTQQPSIRVKTERTVRVKVKNSVIAGSERNYLYLYENEGEY